MEWTSQVVDSECMQAEIGELWSLSMVIIDSAAYRSSVALCPLLLCLACKERSVLRHRTSSVQSERSSTLFV